MIPYTILTISYWCTGNEEAVPRDILTLKGVAPLLFHKRPGGSTSATSESDVLDLSAPAASGSGASADTDCDIDLASAVLSRAAIHRTEASDTRLTVGPPKTVQNTINKNKLTNLTRATQVLAERNKKKVCIINFLET